MREGNWTPGPEMPYAIDNFGCVAISPFSGILVGGHRLNVGSINAVYLFTWESQTLTQISLLDESTRGKVCQRHILTTGESIVLCTLGIKSGQSVHTGETYVYDIAAKTFERMPEWDFPNTLVGNQPRAHTIDNKMLVQTPFGMYMFKDNDISADTSSHWFKIGDWEMGFSAPFNLKYIDPSL